MSRPIDLMPRTCREVLNRRMMVRRWSLVYALTATALFGMYWFLSLANHVRAQERDSLAIKVKINWSRSEVVNKLLKEIAEVEAAVTRYNRLAWPIRASEVVDAVAAAAPPTVSLSELAITPREDKQTSRQASQAKPPGRTPASAGLPGATTAPPRALMVIEMEGVAPDDTAVARFVSGLDSHPLFSRVTLDFTRAMPLGGVEVRNFRVTAEVDLSLRYSFVEATSEGE